MIPEILGSQGSHPAQLMSGEVSYPVQVGCLHEAGLWHAKGAGRNVRKESTLLSNGHLRDVDDPIVHNGSEKT